MKKKLQEEFKRIIGKRIKTDRVWVITKIISISLFSFLGLLISAFHLAYANRIYPGISVVNRSVGNMTIAEASLNLKAQISKLETDKIILTHDDQQWEINLAELNFAYDATATAQKAYQLGRTGNLVKDFQSKTQAWFSGTNLGWEYRLNQDLLETQITTIANQIFVPAIEPQAEIVNQEVKINQGKEGRELDKRSLVSIINYQLSIINLNPIELPVIHITPTLTEEQMENTRQRAEKFLGKKLVLVFNQASQELKEGGLVKLLSFTDGFNQEKIASLAATLASTINRLPQNASFQFEQGRVTQFRPASEGYSLEEEKTLQLIKVTLEEIEKGEAEKETAIHLPVVTTPPAVTIEQINDLGVKELLGRGVSYFWGSIPSRIHNIVLSSSALNGVVIPPGTTFSFNETLGEVSPATGYQTAFVIKEGRTILGDGGGVCQVSTTFFRAALNAGLPIIERHPHSYRVSYYEQGGFGPGLDATVWIPGVDLKFKNDTPVYILIQAYADTKTNTLTFELYGASDGRQVTISKPKVWDQTPPPPDLYQDDPTLPAGTVKRIERAIWGAKASVDWKVSRGDEVLQERTFYSAYQPWQAVYLRGTGQ